MEKVDDMNRQAQPKKKKRFHLDTFIILLLVLLFVAILTWCFNGQAFDYFDSKAGEQVTGNVTGATLAQIIMAPINGLGHALHKDILKNIPFTILEAIIMVCYMYLITFSSDIYISFKFQAINYGFAFILFSETFEAFSILLSLLGNYFSRKAEYAADNNAVKLGYGDSLISALKKITRENFGNLSTSKFYQIVRGNHPTLVERIENIKKKEKELS